VARELVHPEARLLTPTPPRWVGELFGPPSPGGDEHDGDIHIQAAGVFAHAAARVRDAVRLDAPVLRSRVASAYLAILRSLETLQRYPVRFWNFVPGIGDAMPAELDRYMVFNAGRYDAYAERYGAQSITSGSCPSIGTASAVGTTGGDLWIHCLAMDRPGTPVENPRQTSAWRYSTRYGPLPPCFSRATLVPLRERPHLLIGGTASVVGEESRHAGDLDAQLDETLLNMEALVRTASGAATEPCSPLARLIDLRVYLASATDEEPIRRALLQRCPHARTLDIVAAQVCRRELLVEIEGVAEL
jgi:chorismate lyase/3-hydroxybenzoate synthase